MRLLGALGGTPYRRSPYHRSMPNITTFLTFNNQAEDAARFYTSIFPNSRITQVTHYPPGPNVPAPAGSVMTVAFELDGREFVALNGGPQFSFTEGISISVQCDTQEEVDHYWSRLTEGGKPVACGWLTDKFGVSWQINPVLLMQMIADPDPIKANKAMEAMMTMVKIDSEQLKRAWD
jgi:predicted 3-demethylubiquinone-9 3-methyltransferase (glyoxalase superfamily)